MKYHTIFALVASTQGLAKVFTTTNGGLNTAYSTSNKNISIPNNSFNNLRAFIISSSKLKLE